jgi:DNA-binding protein YbaB
MDEASEVEPAAGRYPDFAATLAEVRGTGEACDGKVRVVLDGTSNLVDLVIEPRAMRLGSEELTAGIRTAFAAAREAVQAQLAELTPPFAVTPKETQATLDEVQFEAERRLESFAQMADELARRIDRLA